MNIKAIFFVLIAGYAIWYAEADATRVSEAQVQEMYKQYGAAFERGDKSEACNFFSDKVTGAFKRVPTQASAGENFNKRVACGQIEEFQKMQSESNAAPQSDARTSFTHNISAIDIAPDKKTATVEISTHARVSTAQGIVLDLRTDRTDVVQRRLGKAQIIQSNGTISLRQ